MEKKAIVKFNGGAPVILCSRCRKTLLLIRDLDRTEYIKYIKDELGPMYCERCKDETNDCDQNGSKHEEG